jgi:hypothetical protein
MGFIEKIKTLLISIVILLNLLYSIESVGLSVTHSYTNGQQFMLKYSCHPEVNTMEKGEAFDSLVFVKDEEIFFEWINETIRENANNFFVLKFVRNFKFFFDLYFQDQNLQLCQESIH